MTYKTVTKHSRMGVEIIQDCNLAQIRGSKISELKK